MKYNYFQEEKLKYEDIEIPDELLFVVRQTISADRRKKAARQRARIIKAAGSIAAVLLLCLTIGVNSSYAFAETAVKIPIVKSVAKAVIVRSYRAEIIALDEQSDKQPEKAPDAEQMPEEVIPTISDNDIISEDEVSEQPTEQEPEEELEGFEAWKAEMTPEMFKEVTELYTSDMEERYADAPEKLRTILLAELPEKEVSLYGYHEGGRVTGTALQVKGTYQYFDWNYMNSTKKLPEISSVDTDGDGEEELVIFLYNGEPQKKIIPKEDVEEPKEKTEEVIEEKMSDEGTVEKTISGDDVEETTEEDQKPSISGNDIKGAEEPKETKETPKQQAGEIWIVSLKEENWSASVLSVDDYESQILHQLKAQYDEKAGTVQLYLMEDPLGEPVKILSEEQDKLVYEAVKLAPEREFLTEDGLFLSFNLEAVFSDSNDEKIYFPLNMNLKAEIYLEDDSPVIKNMKERE